MTGKIKNVQNESIFLLSYTCKEWVQTESFYNNSTRQKAMNQRSAVKRHAFELHVTVQDWITKGKKQSAHNEDEISENSSS